jgi:copper chaperone CopZ
MTCEDCEIEVSGSLYRLPGITKVGNTYSDTVFCLESTHFFYLIDTPILLDGHTSFT